VLLLFPKQSIRKVLTMETTAARIAPLDPPYAPAIEETLRRMMPAGVEPLKLFRAIAHNAQVLDRFRSTGTYLLNFGKLDALDREIVIHRTCARCRCEYEWGVHVTVFGRPVGLSEDQIRATVGGDAEDAAWSERQSLLVRLADELHERAAISDSLWQRLAAVWSQEQLIELIAIAGFYHLVSFLANGVQIELEQAGERFPE
jgi:alkylhydroperoxidase family enzyme